MCLYHICFSLREEGGSAGFEPVIFRQERDRCQGNLSSAYKNGPDGILVCHPTLYMVLQGKLKSEKGFYTYPSFHSGLTDLSGMMADNIVIYHEIRL